MREYGLFIDGKFVASSSGETMDSIDPSTGEIVARVPKATQRDARKAIDAARRAFDDGVWSERSPESRRDSLLALCDRLWDRQAEIADLESRDSGMTIRNATVMVAAAGNIYYGLWYPIVVAVMTLIIGTLFLRDAKDFQIHD